MAVKRGEIWWASLPDPVGSEPGYRRPVLIIQSDEFNRSGIRTVICSAITTNLNLAGAPGNVQLSARISGLSKPSVVNVSQLLSIDRTRLTERIKGIDTESMRLIDEGLRLILTL
jgi:mRNA interferase MazF